MRNPERDSILVENGDWLFPAISLGIKFYFIRVFLTSRDACPTFFCVFYAKKCSGKFSLNFPIFKRGNTRRFLFFGVRESNVSGKHTC